MRMLYNISLLTESYAFLNLQAVREMSDILLTVIGYGSKDQYICT